MYQLPWGLKYNNCSFSASLSIFLNVLPSFMKSIIPVLWWFTDWFHLLRSADYLLIISCMITFHEILSHLKYKTKTKLFSITISARIQPGKPSCIYNKTTEFISSCLALVPPVVIFVQRNVDNISFIYTTDFV